MMPEVILPPRVYSREPAYPLWAHADAVPPAGAGEWAVPPSNPAPRAALCPHTASGGAVRFSHVPKSTLLHALLAFLVCEQKSTLGYN